MNKLLSIADYENLLHFNSLIQNSKSNDFEYYVLKLLHDLFGFDHSVFGTFSTDGEMENMIGYNINDLMINEYMQNLKGKDLISLYVKEHIYGHTENQYPFVITLTDILSDEKYKNSAYYDFLIKNSLHYNMTLVFNKLSEGISLLRTQEKGLFTDRERYLTKHLSKIIAPHYYQIQENRILQDEVGLFNKSKENMNFGFLIFDKELKLIYFNKIALDYCCAITGKFSLDNVLNEIRSLIFGDMNKNGASGINRSTSTYKSINSYVFEISAMGDLDSNNIMDTYYTINLYDEKWFKSITNISNYVEPYILTQREKEIVSLVAKGLSNQNIADQLFISLYTVKAHMKNIFKKMDVTNRSSLIAKVYNIANE